MELKLPPSVAGKRDIIKLQRNIETLLDQTLQKRVAETHSDGTREVSKPDVKLIRFMEHNNLEMQEEVLKQVHKHLESIRNKAPTIRIAFANEPDDENTEKIVTWFRRNVSPQILVQIGVQPTIAGGAVVQTPLHRFDFSLRQHLLASVPKFLEVMKGVS